MSYQDYISLYNDMGCSATTGKLELFQAENYYRQSSAALWPEADKSNSLTQPFSYYNTKINYGGGQQWKTPGQWIMAIVAYVCIVFIMFNGAQRLEKRQMARYGDDPAYNEYANKTPIIIPLLPIYHLNKKN